MWGEGLQGGGSDPPGNVDVHVCVCVSLLCVCGCFNIQAALSLARISLNSRWTCDASEFLSSLLKMSKKLF